MTYRGEDLDLRTPQGWGGAVREGGQLGDPQPNWWTRSTVFNGGRADPLWVDDLVMGCCNHAFDLAVAHRAPEVRLEHLINALTLTEGAHPALETRGLRIATLRRDSAQVIAGEIPAALNGRGAPRKSDDLEEVLRLAADRAYPRRTPITVDDILTVLFDSNRALPAVALLMRHVGPPPPREPEPRWDTPAFAPRGYAGPDPRYLDRYEPARQLPPVAYVPQSSDPRLLDRLDALDRLVRDLADDTGASRKALAAAMTTIQSALAKQADDDGKRMGEIAKRIEALESRLGAGDTVETRLGELDRSATLTLDRLARLERLFGDTRDVTAPVPAHLTEIRNQLGALTSPDGNASIATAIERIATVEHLTETRAAETGRTIAFIAERLRAFEEQVSHLHGRVGEAISSFTTGGEQLDRLAARQSAIGDQFDNALGDRLVSIESSIAESKTAAAEIANAHVQDLIELHDALEKLSSNQTQLSSALEQWRLDSMGDLSIVSNRLAALEATATQPWSVLRQMETTLEEVRAATTARQSRWRSFKMWLFGTENWRSDVGLKNTKVGEKLRTSLRREKL